MTHEVEELRLVLSRVARRVGIAAAWRVLARAACVMSVGLLLWALATAVVPVPFPLGASAAACMAALALAFPLLAWRLRPPLGAAADITDRQMALADRLGTALEVLRRSPRPAGVARLQVADAVRAGAAVSPPEVAPLRVPRDAWAVLAACALLVVWARFLAGWSVPASPAARATGAIHREGRTLVAAGRRLDQAAQAGVLPEARREAPRLAALGHRLEGPRITREDALRALLDAGRQLEAAQQQIARRIAAAGSGARGGAAGQERLAAPPADASAASQRIGRLQAAVRAMRALTGQLRPGGSPTERPEVSQALRALSESLARMGGDVPVSARRSVARAREEAARGHLSAASGSLRDALEDLQGYERMLGDEQALGDARRDVQRAEQHVAAQGPLGGAADTPQQGQHAVEAPPPAASGSTPPSASTTDQGAPPPPGPNQGSLPGRGTGPALGTPTPRLGGTRAPVYLAGIPGNGPSTVKEIVAPGRAGQTRLGAGRPSANVAHATDQALSQAPLPPAYLVLVRRYFESLGGAP